MQQIIEPYDDKKPLVPYVRGCKFTAKQHRHPPPQRQSDNACTNTLAETKRLQKLHPIERCLQHPPLQGSYGSSRIDLYIQDTLHVGDGLNAQVVVVEVLMADPSLSVEGLSRGDHVVAKLYDPLYMDDDDLYINPFRASDQDYIHEATIYEALPDLQGSAIPRYYGSYTMETPVELERKRRVQLILIEGISGSLMKHIRPREMPQKTRQTIMKTLIDFDTIVYSRDIILADLHPRDVILTDAVQGRAVFIDFAAAEFFWSDTLSDSEARCLQTTDTSPLLRWHEAWGRFEEFGKWIDWDWQPWLEAEFGHTAASITPEVREMFLPAWVVEGHEEYKQQ